MCDTTANAFHEAMDVLRLGFDTPPAARELACGVVLAHLHRRQAELGGPPDVEACQKTTASPAFVALDEIAPGGRFRSNRGGQVRERIGVGSDGVVPWRLVDDGAIFGELPGDMWVEVVSE